MGVAGTVERVPSASTLSRQGKPDRPVPANGLAIDEREDSGYAGEPHWVSPSATCFERLGDPSIPVLVFGADGSFRGTEPLIRANLYTGQPCPQDEVLHLPFGYVACHHYGQ